MAASSESSDSSSSSSSSADEYNDDELAMISHQIKLCLRDLPRLEGDYYATQIRDACAERAWQALDDVPQRELTPVVVRCLRGYSQVSQQQVSAAQRCLAQRLARSYRNFKVGVGGGGGWWGGSSCPTPRIRGSSRHKVVLLLPSMKSAQIR